MSNNNFAPIPPIVPNGDDLVPGIIESDDEVVLDPDAAPDKVESAEEDRIASGADDADADDAVV